MINIYNTADTNHINGTVVGSLSTTDVIEIVLLGLTLIVGLLGNVLVITVISCYREMLTRTNIFLLNVAIADLGALLFCLPFVLTSILHQEWRLGNIFCHIQGFMNTFWLCASVFTLIGLSVHKYFSIKKPARRIITTRRALIMIIVSWIVAGLCAAVPFIGWNRIIFKPYSKFCAPAPSETTAQYVHVIFLFFISYILPIVVVAYLYVRIFQAVSTHRKLIRKTRVIDDRGILGQKRILVTICIVFVVSMLFWTPFYCHSLLVLTVGVGTKSHHLLRFTYICGFLSNACNPVIYFLRNPRFRRGFIEILSCYRLRYFPNGKQLNSSRFSSSSVISRDVPVGYLAEKRCSMWYFSGENSLLNIIPVEPERRLKLRWIETNL